MALSPEELYQAHVLNLRSVKIGVERVERELRSAISRGDEVSSEALLKILLLLVGGWAECRLRKLLYEPNGFGEEDRRKITAERHQLGWWRKSLEVGFRKRYQIPRANLQNSLRPTARMLYIEMFNAVDSDLKPIIEIRNTLAHGQWARPLNSDSTDISSNMIRSLNNENALSARFKITILESLAATLHDLVSGNDAFERDFDSHFTKLENARRNLSNRSYQDWKDGMVRKYSAGRQKRNALLAEA